MRVVALPPFWLLAVAVTIALLVVWVTKPRLWRIAPLAITGLVWLPYIPGGIPPAFLIWHGPIQIGVWVIAVAGLIGANVGGRAARSPLTDARLAPWIAAVIAAAAFAVGAAALRDRLPVGDEPHYLMMTQSLIKDGDLRIENNHKNRDYASFYAVEIPPHYLTRGVDGEIYSNHAPGVSALVLPAFALFGYYGAVATVILCVALASALGWHAAWLLTGSLGAAWLSWAAVFLTAPVYLHAITVFPDAVGTLAVMGGLWLLIVLEREHRVTSRSLVGVSVMVAVLPWLHSRFAIIAAGLGLAILWRLARRGLRDVTTFLVAPSVSAALWFGFFWIIWGTPSPAAPWGAGLTAQLAWIPRGVLGLLSDQQAGLLPSAPVYLCAVTGWLVLFRRHTRLAVETSLVASALLLSVASYEPWWGGQGGPARYLVAALPLALPAIAIGAATAGSWGRHTAALGVTASMLLLIARIAADRGAYAYFPEGGRNPLLQRIAPSVELSSTLPSLVGIRDAHFIAIDSPESFRTWLIWGMTILTVALLCRFWASRAPHRFTISTLAAAIAVMIAVSGVWYSEQRSGLAPLQSELAFLKRWDSKRQPVTIEWRRPYFTSLTRVTSRIEIATPPKHPVDLPPGSYDVSVEGTAATPVELSATLGDSPLPLLRQEVTEATHGLLRLPVGVVGLRFELKDPAMPATIRLRPAVLPMPAATARAIRAARFGDVRVFYLDDDAYPEPGGFWARAKTETAIVVDREDTPDRSLGVRLQSGPVPTTVDLIVDGRNRRLEFAAHQRREIEIPLSQTGVWSVTIRSSHGFRPVDHNPEVRDYRNLGVWIEVF